MRLNGETRDRKFYPIDPLLTRENISMWIYAAISAISPSKAASKDK